MEDALKTTTREQDAVRLLMLLRHAHDDALPNPHPDGAITSIAGELRLQAMDFWLRNPDYLAEELLNLADRTGNSELRESARRVVLEEEPDVRTYPMLRHRHGAWEPLDDSIGLLKAYGLASGLRHGSALQGRRDFFLFSAGALAADDLVERFPDLRWYSARASLVHLVAGNTGGTELKQRQKEQFEYRDADWRRPIPGIRIRVLERLHGESQRSA